MPSSGSNYSAFLDSYNKGNSLLDMAAENFERRTKVDETVILNKDNGILKDKMTYLSDVLLDRSKSGYDKLAITGSILADIAKDILTSNDSEVKKSGANIIKSFFDVAKETEDQQLINSAVRIADIVSSSVPERTNR